MLDTIIISGQGGQGALLVGQMIAYAGLDEGYEVSWMPSYGAEMRGGTAHCAVTVSTEKIASPEVKRPLHAIAMNLPSVDKFDPLVAPGGTLFINSDLAEVVSARSDVRCVAIHADTLAEKFGNPKGGNMVMLGAYLAVSECINPEGMVEVARKIFSGRKAKFAQPNIDLFWQGYRLVDSGEAGIA